MAKKKQEVSMDAPGWMVTFGDMMSLLLCFFVMLFSLSELKSDKIYEAVVSIKAFFNVRSIVSSKKPTTTLTSPEQLRLNIYEPRFAPHRERGGQPVPHPFGPNVKVESIRDSLRIVLGGKAAFGQGGLDVSPEMDGVLTQIASRIKGGAMRIEIRGHASPEPEDQMPGMDKWDLSWRRAELVARELQAKGLDPRRFRISGLAQYDPVSTNLLEGGRDTEEGRFWNRRVEIVVLPEVVPDILDGRVE